MTRIIRDVVMAAVMVVGFAALVLSNALPGVSGEPVISMDVPYEDGARYEYAVLDKKGEQLGTVEYRTILADWNSKQTWAVYKVSQLTDGSAEEAVAYVDLTNLAPLAGESVVAAGDTKQTVAARYEGDHVRVELDANGSPTAFTLMAVTPAYDATQVPMLLRAFPLEEGFQHNFAVVYPGDRDVLAASAEVVDRETVDTLSGPYEAWKVELKLKGGITHYAWYWVEAPHVLVKFDYGDVQHVLVQRQE